MKGKRVINFWLPEIKLAQFQALMPPGSTMSATLRHLINQFIEAKGDYGSFQLGLLEREWNMADLIYLVNEPIEEKSHNELKAHVRNIQTELEVFLQGRSRFLAKKRKEKNSDP